MLGTDKTITYELEIVVNPCDPPTVFTQPAVVHHTYDMGAATATYTVDPFTTDNLSCTSFTHAAVMARHDGSTPSAAFQFTETADGLTHTWFSDDLADLGMWRVTITCTP